MRRVWAPSAAGFGPAFLSAVLLALSYPPFHLLLLPFVALVPLVAALASPGSKERGAIHAARMGLLFGLTHWGIILFWIPLVMGPFFPWALPGYLALLLALGCLSAFFCWGVHRLHHRVGVPLALAVPVAWVGVEWLRGHLPMGLAFPWLGLSLGLTPWPELLSLAEWLGQSGVDFWLAAVNGMFAAVLRGFGTARTRKGRVSWPWTRTLRRFMGLALLIALPGGLSLQRARGLPLEDGPRVAVVGTSVSRELRLNPEAALREAGAQLNTNLAALATGQVDLVVLPESVIPLPLHHPDADSLRSELEEWALRLQAPLVFGSLGLDLKPAENGRLTNSIFLLTPEGLAPQRYDKRHLVPVMESGSYRRGEGGLLHSGAGLGLGPLVCYESLFGGLSRRHRRQGAEVLVNISSDVWFGDEAGGVAGFFLHQHPAHLVLRAVENRMPVARAANGGYSLLLGPSGRPISSPVGPKGGLGVGTLPVYPPLTLYTRVGDLVGPAAALSLVALLLFFIPTPLRWPGHSPSG